MTESHIQQKPPFRYISPTTDFGFKKVFGDERIMKGFLNALFESENAGIKIESLEYIDKEAAGAERLSRGVVYDLKCRTSEGEVILVEMQNEGQDFFENRIIYYLARAVSVQGFKKVTNKKGEEEDVEDETWDFDIKRVIGVFLMNYFDKKDKEKVSRNCWMNTKTHEISSDRQEYWKVQLPYYRKHRMKESDCNTKLEYWLFNIANMEKMDDLAFKEKESDFVYLSDLAEFNAMSTSEQDQYIKVIDQEVVYNNALDRRYRFGYEDGEAKGIEKGRTEGKREEKILIARKLKSLGVPVSQISSATELDAEEIENI